MEIGVLEMTNLLIKRIEREASGVSLFEPVELSPVSPLGTSSVVASVDGGVTNWTQQLFSNQKERLFISGIGAERACSVFAP